MINRILIISDSLPLPREKPEVTAFEETWPELLKNKGFKIHQVSVGGATSSDLLKQVYYHQLFRPDIVFIQVGIVDCAPRFATKFELETLSKIPFLGKKILKKINTPKVRDRRKISYVGERQFGKNILSMKNSFTCPVFFLTILPATDNYELILPGISKKINDYNKILKLHNHIDLNRIPSNCIMSDHHHLNMLGHEFIFNKILSVIK